MLGKRVVVQHLPLGGIMKWNDNISAPSTTVTPLANNVYSATPAPWASGTRTTVITGTDALMTAGPRDYPNASIIGGGSTPRPRLNSRQNGP